MLQKTLPEVLQKRLQKRLFEVRNEENNEDEAPNVHRFASHPSSDDYNKESLKNTSLDGPNKSKTQNPANNTSYCEDVMKSLFLLICYLKQFVHCQQQQASDGMVMYTYTACLTIAFVNLDVLVTGELHNMIHRWKELCNIVIQYWPNLLDTVQGLEELPNDGIQQWKQIQQTMMSHCLCSIPSFPVTLYHSYLSYFSSFPVDLNLQNNPRNYVTLHIVMFANGLSDDVLLVCNTATKPIPSLFMSIFGSFLCHHKLLQQVKSFSGMGRQASDRSDNNGKRSRGTSETSKRSGSAGSSTSSSTTGGGYYGVRRTGSTGSCGNSGRGDDDENDDGWKRDRTSRYIHDTPRAKQWEEEDSKDNNEASSPTTTPCSASGKIKTKKRSHKTAAPITYELALRTSNGLYMWAVTSPMMNNPLSGDDPYGESPHDAAAAASNYIITDRCCESYHDKLLYSDEMPRSYKNLRILCLPVYCCEPVTAQACDEDVLPPRHSANTTEAVSIVLLLPPPGGGNDVQFKDTLMILCTVVATVYCNLYNDHCYFDHEDLNIHRIFLTRDLETGKVTSVSIHAIVHQLEDCDENIVRTSTNEGLMSLANSIYSPYQYTEYKDSAEGILTIMKHNPSYENDMDVLRGLLKYHDGCVPFTNTTVAYVL